MKHDVFLKNISHGLDLHLLCAAQPWSRCILCGSSPASSVLAREGAGCGSVGDVPGKSWHSDPELEEGKEEKFSLFLSLRGCRGLSRSGHMCVVPNTHPTTLVSSKIALVSPGPEDLKKCV